MPNKPLICAEVSLEEDPSEGLRVECSEKHAELLRTALANAGFDCKNFVTVLNGTINIPDWVRVSVSGGTFEDMRNAALSSLREVGITVSESVVSGMRQKSVRLTLTNVSVFK